ncbi:MAG: sigma-70 family RNA polymerase sigma factor [Prevotella sp.]|nr:sigma-70 family RNA polymerase sigma factor [Prevotella sp.]
MDKDKNALNTYLNEIGHERKLTDQEEKDLAERIKMGDSRAIDKLTSANLTFVVSVANHYKGRGVDIEDLISEGNIGMLRAALKFDANMDKRFVTFAAPYIREAIEQAVEQQAGFYRVPRDVKNPVLEKKRSRMLSIDAPVGGSTELSLGRVIPDHDAPNPDRLLEDDLLLGELNQLLNRLDDRERMVIKRFYGVGDTHLTMAEIAQQTGLKRERVRQIRDKAIRRICRMTKSADLKNFLRS